jgi:hypothetical protein
MTGLKCWIKAGLRPPFRIVQWMCRPVAARLRGFLLAPLAPYLEAVPRLCLLADCHGELLIQLKDAQSELLRQLQDRHSSLEQRVQNTTQAVLHLQGQLERGLAVVQSQQGQILSDLQGHLGVTREAERMLLALLKSAQFIPPKQEVMKPTAHLYREVANAASA